MLAAFLVLESSATGTMASTGSLPNDTPSSGKFEEHPTKNGGSGKKWCKVLFSYEPCNADELTLIPGDSIEFLGEVEQGWWRGRLKGQVGVFPSNFVAPPIHEEPEKHKEYEKRELCRVLYPYRAVNEDELTLNEGDIITIISKDAPDKGWWKGELRGHIGLFPDNFVDVIDGKSDHVDQDERDEAINNLTLKYMQHLEKADKTHMRKNLDTSSFVPDVISHTEVSKKGISTPSLSSATATSPGGTTNTGEKKNISGHSIISNLKRLVSDVTTNNSNGAASTFCDSELDGVERGEGAPLSHLTASRAKAPRRRPPSQRLRLRHAASLSNATTTSATTPENSLSNGNAENTLSDWREEDTADGLTTTVRKKAPWAQELKLSQLERRKIVSTDRIEKSEGKKERMYTRLSSSNIADAVNKSEGENDGSKHKDKEKDKEKEKEYRNEMPSHLDQSASPAYVPYSVYSKLLERVAVLEEKQTALQQTVEQLSKQLLSVMANTSADNKD